ncbi:related to PMR1-Ca++-transporting P-type ATPase located in Golgi [Phialocephala subalpina]|uniref:Related to PMR1-Ca++-transporting P-type ATPase located in Golgi n=1 Tax=Phialocephala subalpina TaxID=576137 RepID=A0A1L7X225_9HELO|nr:related to PMR1-Ca++-transporting P-type ATPase located in Golgi [Phialocephala subalpina]
MAEKNPDREQESDSEAEMKSQVDAADEEAPIRSTASSRRRRYSVDLATALLITFRTVSYAIEEIKEKEKAEAVKAKKDAATEFGGLEWHTWSVSEVENRLETSIKQGLSSEQVTRKQKEFGKNAPSKPPSDLFSRLIGYMFGGFGSVLLIGGILVTITYKQVFFPEPDGFRVLSRGNGADFEALMFRPLGEPTPAVANLALAIVLTMASISGMLPDDCFVLRDGNRVEFVAADLVPGDILCIKSGNKLPADVHSSKSLLMLTGNTLGVTVSTGDKTIFGKIAKLTNTPKTSMTTLQKEILRFIIIICSLMLFFNVVVIICWVAWLRHDHPSWISVAGLIVDIVTVAVAFIPEVLPIALTASLTITASIMKSNEVLCKSLKTVETLGAVSNHMFVTECSVADRKMTPEIARDWMVTSEADGSNNAISQLRSCAGLCNAGEFNAATSHLPLLLRKITGDATDQAVLRLSESFGPGHGLQLLWKKTFELAFNGKNKSMIRTLAFADPAGLNLALAPSEAKNDQDLLLMIKGAPDMIVERCTSYVGEDGEVLPLDLAMKAVIEDIKNQWPNQGKRGILLARKILPGHQSVHNPVHNTFEAEVTHQAGSGLTLIGLVGIVHPPRDEIPEVVRILRRAGIRIFMVTGDFKLSAQAIAIECGIITNPAAMVHDVTALSRDHIIEPAISKGIKDSDLEKLEGPMKSITLSGPELITLNDNQWEQLCGYDEILFARTTPEQKLRIVKELRKSENLVGMTGDGVNDAPSLKAADIGIALGSGSDIAIEAADMVLLNSFGAIVKAVKYGRVVSITSRKQSSTFSLPILGSFLMIMICCLTDCAAATVLAYEKPRSGCPIEKTEKCQDGQVDRLEALATWIWLSRNPGISLLICHGLLVGSTQSCPLLRPLAQLFSVSTWLGSWICLQSPLRIFLYIFCCSACDAMLEPQASQMFMQEVHGAGG